MTAIEPTHWAYQEILELYPGIEVAPDYPRYVVDPAGSPRVVTGGGISSGLDEGLKIASLVTSDDHARLIQLVMQYEPVNPTGKIAL